ncbi:3735_t:CDS:2, partial [Ambispora gerdemannii]
KITELKEKYAKVKAEKAELEIMKKNSKHKADHTKLKEDTTNLKTKNTELEVEIVKLRYDIEKIKKKGQIITNIQNAFSTEEILFTLSDASNSNEFNNVPNSDVFDNTYMSNIKSNISPEQKKEQDLIQEILIFINQNNITEISQNNIRQNHVIEIFQNNVHQNYVTEIVSDQDIIYLYQNACDVEKDTIKANQKEIL